MNEEHTNREAVSAAAFGKHSVIIPAKWRLLGPLVALLGGFAGLLGAFFHEGQGGLPGIVLLPFVAAPIIEETLKPSGIYLLLAKWPQALTGRFHTAFLSGLAGLEFGALENLLYLYVYFPEHSHEAAVVRWTAGLTLHSVNSFIVGLGINQKLIAAAKGEIPLFSANKRFFLIPMAIHSAYNVLAVVFLRHLQ